MQNTKRYPLNFENLKKGDVITEDQLVEILKEPKESVKFWSKKLALRMEIMDRLAEMGNPVTVKETKGDLVILTDLEASTYNNRMFTNTVRQLVRTHNRSCQVDDSDFGEDERKRHRRMIEINGRTIQGALLGRRGKLQLPPYERTTPGLIKFQLVLDRRRLPNILAAPLAM